MYIMQLHAGMLPAPGRDLDLGPAPATDGWKFYARCEQDDPYTCSFLFEEPQGFSSVVRKQFVQLLQYLFEAGGAGVAWANVFRDGKLFHPIHEVAVTRRDATGRTRAVNVKVMQFKKKRADIRVLFVQTDVGTCNVVFLHSYEKGTAKTPAAEQRRAADSAQAFYSALDTGALRMLTQQGGGDATQRFR